MLVLLQGGQFDITNQNDKHTYSLTQRFSFLDLCYGEHAELLQCSDSLMGNSERAPDQRLATTQWICQGVEYYVPTKKKEAAPHVFMRDAHQVRLLGKESKGQTMCIGCRYSCKGEMQKHTCIYFHLQRCRLPLGHWIIRVWEQCLPSGEENQTGKERTYLPLCLPFMFQNFVFILLKNKYNHN